jgi:diguanylate cyclase (GGDEF)-like protein/putative nucleotidyltransferase with HDIG domain
MPRLARLYLGATLLAGFVALAAGLSTWRSTELVRFACYLAISTLASAFKVRLPGITGTMSANFFFLLICITTMNLAQGLIVACVGTVLQCVWRTKNKPSAMKVLFNVANIAVAVTTTAVWLHWLSARGVKPPIALLLAALIYFVANTAPVAIIVGLTEKKPLVRTWRECYFWALPYYLVGAAVAGVLGVMDRFFGWETSLLIFPIIYWIYRSYRLYLERLDAEKRHVEETAGLHLRTIEALALAIEAKDVNTYDHLRRVGVYALELAKLLDVNESEKRALQAASLLHDIGKLAIPEHILSKPGKLTPVEFEKVKTHPLVGAEILESVEFPYPVCPIVAAHHEKWDGTGYPHGLSGEEIPIGARILAVVDCFDAMTTDRQYRRAVPVQTALDYIVAEGGKSFDPRIVDLFLKHHGDLEALALATKTSRKRLSRNVRVEHGRSTGAGLERPRTLPAAESLDVLSSIAAARQEAQALFELAHELGNSLSLHETLSVLTMRLKRMCKFDCISIYVLRDGVLVPEFVSGRDEELFSALEIPLGEGLSGWVAQSRRSVVNGNPSVEPSYLHNFAIASSLRSALAVPLEGPNGVIGVLALYSDELEAFTTDHHRLVSAVSGKLALCIENGLRFRQVESCATTDALTSLPNARSLFLHLDSELSRARREQRPVSVLVCDLDGFKQVNDQFGHLEGNRVLRRMGEALRENCREYDYVARMGGDEFVVVLSGDSRSAVEGRIQSFQALARRVGREIVGRDLLSMSIGHASFPIDGTDTEQLLAEADRRMYKVKHVSRNTQRVEDLASLSVAASAHQTGSAVRI